MQRHERIRGRRGVLLRQQVKREEVLCKSCLAKGRIAAVEEVDHIIPLSKGGTNDRDNLQALCKECHEAKTTGRAKQRIGADGWPE